MNEPLVSVVISTWNRVDLLKGAIASIENQDYPNIELIVVDNASNDGTLDYMQDLKNEFDLFNYGVENHQRKYLLNNMSLIKYNRLSKPDPSAMKTLNMGFKEAKGKYILVLDDDAFFNETYTLSTLVDIMEFDTGIGVLCPNNVSIDGSTQLLEYRDAPNLNFGRMYAYSGSCALMRADVFKELGMYDESFVLYWNEADVAIKMLYAGYDVMYDNKVSATHLVSPKQRFMRKSLYYHLRNGNMVLNRSLSFWNRLHIIPMRSINILYVILDVFEFDLVYDLKMFWQAFKSLCNIFVMRSRYRPYNKEIFREVNDALMKIQLYENKGWTFDYWKNMIINWVKDHGFRS